MYKQVSPKSSRHFRATHIFPLLGFRPQKPSEGWAGAQLVESLPNTEQLHPIPAPLGSPALHKPGSVVQVYNPCT